MITESVSHLLKMHNTLEEIMWDIERLLQFLEEKFEVEKGKCPEREKQRILLREAHSNIYSALEEEVGISGAMI